MGMMEDGWLHTWDEWKGSYLYRELDMVLYRLCQENWRHTDEEMVRAKFAIVNRVYSAGAVRHVNKNHEDFKLGTSEPFVKELMASRKELDKKLEHLREKYSLEPYLGSTLSTPVVDKLGLSNAELARMHTPSEKSSPQEREKTLTQNLQDLGMES